MVRVTTVWDKIDDVNTKVFMVRGDEAYARTTDVKFSLKYINHRDNDVTMLVA